MYSLRRLFYHLVAFLLSLAGLSVAIAALPFRLVKRLQILYVVSVLAPIIAFWMGSRWPQTPSIVWSSPGVSLSSSGENLQSLTADLSAILDDWRSAEGEIGRMIKEGEESYERVWAGHRELLDRFEIIEAGVEGGGLVVAGEKGIAKELSVAKKLWKEVGDLKEVMEAGRKTFVDATSRYQDAVDRFVALENRVDVVETEIKDVVSRHEGSSALIVNLIAASANNNEKAHDRFDALETRVEEVAGEISSIAEQQSTGEDLSMLIETLVEAASAIHDEEARTRLVALETRVEEVADELNGMVQQQSSGEDVSTLVSTLR